MIKIYTPEQRADLFAQARMIERLSSADLFNWSAQPFVRRFQTFHHSRASTIHIFAGSGENGAFALAIARHLHDEGYNVRPYLFYYRGHLVDECEEQKKFYQDSGATLYEVTESFSLPEFRLGECIIDGLFAGEFYGALPPAYCDLVDALNSTGLPIYSLDLPTGLINEVQQDGRKCIIKATRTITFESPRLALLQPSNTAYIGLVDIIPLGLGEGVHDLISSDYYLMSEEDLTSELKQYKDNQHHAGDSSALIIGGSLQSLGALSLATEACLRSGVAQLEVSTLQGLNSTLQLSQPEAIISVGMGGGEITIPQGLEGYSAINIGLLANPSSLSKDTFVQFLNLVNRPIVCSDLCISYFSRSNELLDYVPKDSFLVCTLEQSKELFGRSLTEEELLSEARTLSGRKGIYLLILSPSVALCTPSGSIYYTKIHHASFYKRGMSAVFVGLLTGFLAQGYSAMVSVLASSRIFSEAIDLCYARSSASSFLARDVAARLGEAIRETGL